jgi:hypothetical protein
MPHEKIHDRHNRSTLPGEEVQPPQPFLEVGWSSGPTPLHEDEQPDGWVQVSANRDTTGARIPCENLDYAQAMTAELLQANPLPGNAKLDPLQIDSVARLLAGHMRYAWGEDIAQLAIQLDREGCNRVIRTVRRARDKAYGADA